MASLIKNQIIKRLSKFVKNLSSNQINLSTLKGEGELSSIDLDEQALEDVIELPTWLKIQKATCGRVFIKIPWASLKTSPIQLQLDEVNIEIVTCQDLRPLNRTNDSTTNNDPLIGKYSFINRVIDGISLSITSLTFTIKAKAFKASIFLPTLDIYSVSPRGERVDTLKFTRIRNAAKDHILLFKEISWANARIEASSNDVNLAGAAIRLIANACRVRISMKKNLDDSTMVTSRVMLHFDDLLSVINDAQLKSALNAYKEILQLIKRSSEQRKSKAGEKLTKLEEQQQRSSFQPRGPMTGLNDPSNLNPSMNIPNQSRDPFERYDVVETSLHFNIKRLDLHIIADSEILSQRLAESGALQLTLANLSIDHYPYHEYGSSKHHWVKYNEMQSSNRDEWAKRLKDQWIEELNAAKAKAGKDDMSMKFEKALDNNRIRLFESCTVLNIDDLVFYPVSLNNQKEQKRRRPLLKSDRTQYQLPEYLGVVNIQHTEYYYPVPYSFPVPNADLHIQIMPMVMRIDFATMSWLDAFSSAISMTIDKSGVLNMDKSTSPPEHIAIKLDAMLPRIVVSSDIFSGAKQLEIAKHDQQPTPDILDRSENVHQEQIEILELNISKLILTNCRAEFTSDRKRLQQHLTMFNETNFFQENRFPFSTDSSAVQRISSLFEKDPMETYLYKNPLNKSNIDLSEPPSGRTALHQYYSMTTDSLKKSSKYDIWHMLADSIYMDFTPLSSTKQNMTDTFSVLSWSVIDQLNDSSSWLNVLGVIESPSMLKISQKQYTFLMHLVDEFGLFLDVLDRNKMQTRLIKEQISIDQVKKGDGKEMKMTVCLHCPRTFTLAVLDGLKETKIDPLNSSLPTTTSLPEAELEPTMNDSSDGNLVVDLVTAAAPIVAGTVKFEAPASPSIQINDQFTPNDNLSKGFNLLGQKKSKIEEQIQRGLEISSKTSRGSSQSSMMNLSEMTDDSSQWDQLSEDLDADSDLISLNNDFEQQQQPQQQKAARIELDDDNSSLAEKTSSNPSNSNPKAIEPVNGVFIKLTGLQLCLTNAENKDDRSLTYVAGQVKYLRIDEFHEMKIESLKPKLFDNERPDKVNDENVLPIKLRLDFTKGDEHPPPILTIKLHDRSLMTTTHSIDVILQNLEEIHTDEEKSLRKSRPKKLIPIDLHLTNVQMILEMINEFATTDVFVDSKPPMKIFLEKLHLRREIDGHIHVQSSEDSSQTKSFQSNVEHDEKRRELERMKIENEKLRSELKTQKNEINILRGERDSLMKTISKLDVELTEAEYQRTSQVQKGKK